MKIHLIGIGGVGMAGLAVLLKRRGHVVSGCDLKASARTRWLASLGIPVAIGHDPRHVEGQDLVIVTPAVVKDNPEYVAAIGRGRPSGGPDSSPSVGSAPRADRPRCLRRGEALAKLVSDAPDSIAVCGSHGKTTTATFIAKLLIALGESVEWAIGGETGDFPVAGQSNNQTVKQSNNSTVLVVEADESDGSLAEYAAKTLVVTNCEYDHADHFKTRADYIACYDAARAKAREVVEARARDARREARAETRDARRETSCLSSLVSRPCPQPTLAERLRPPLAGLAPHNCQNALLAAEVALRRGHAPDAIAAALPEVVAHLPDRRFQRVWPVEAARNEDTRRETRDVSGEDMRHETRDASGDKRQIYTDYAHHPTEMACAVAMARAAAKGRVIVLFQPHRYSRTKALKNEFPKAFAGADEVILCPTYAAFEKPVAGGDITDLYESCRAAFADPAYQESSALSGPPRLSLAPSCEAAWEQARAGMRPGDLVLLLGAGDIVDLVPRIQAQLGEERHLLQTEKGKATEQ